MHGDRKPPRWTAIADTANMRAHCAFGTGGTLHLRIMDLTVPIPPTFDGASLSPMIKRIIDGSGGNRIERLKFDFSGIRFIDPCGVVFLSNVCHWFMENGTSVSFSSMDKSRAPVRFLDDALFFQQHCG